ncbi:MAG: calcium-binding protein, partial [Bauldia sp.]|nr:calcium-binding protein [Bauldia sp.]
ADNDDLNGLAGNDKLIGGIGQDDLDGGSGRDRLKGGPDNDRLDGGSESDILSGGGGSNQFVFSTALSAKNIDRITDFKVGFDSIELSHKVFGALPVGALSASEFHQGSSAKTADQHVIYNAKRGLLIYDSNGNAKGGDHVFAKLDAHLSLSDTDFLII